MSVSTEARPGDLKAPVPQHIKQKQDPFGRYITLVLEETLPPSLHEGLKEMLGSLAAEATIRKVAP